jgi:hypothetical protein
LANSPAFLAQHQRAVRGFQTQLAIAQQVAAQQVQAQRQADKEAAERLASAALGQYIAPTSAAPARTRTVNGVEEQRNSYSGEIDLKRGR